jgi:molybdopterin molybdotransferase
MNSPPFFDVRARGFRDRADVSAVEQLLLARLTPLPAEPVALATATGRVLATTVTAQVAVPGFVRAAMDGFAVQASDTFAASPHNPLELTIVGQAFPAQPCPQTVQAGQAVQIMTGAPVPAGADAVVPAEYVRVVGAQVQIIEPIAPQRHIGRVGEDVACGQTVLTAGRVLRPQDVGVLASIGVGHVTVVRQPRVALLVTGNELLPPGSVPTGYQIVDSNSPMLRGLVARDGALVTGVRYLPDDRATIRTALTDTAADVLLVSGGSSVGQEDHAPSVVAELGTLAIHGVALRPASPTGVGWIADRLVFLLPGNPVSCLCAYDLFVGLALRRLGGRPLAGPYRQQVLPLTGKISSALGRVDYVRVRRTADGVEPLAVSGAALLTTTTQADGYVLVPVDCEGYPPGTPVTLWAYDG